LCNGQAVSKSQYSALYSIISDAFRDPSNSDLSTFNVPDMRDLFPIGSSATKALASKGGNATHTISIGELAAHNHGASSSLADHQHALPPFTHTHTDSGHTHSITGFVGVALRSGGGTVNTISGSATSGVGQANIQGYTTPVLPTYFTSQYGGIPAVTTSIANTGSGTPFSLIPPYIALNFIIKG